MSTMSELVRSHVGSHAILGLSTEEIGSSTSDFSSSIRTSYWAAYAAFHALAAIISIILLIAVRVVPSSLRKTADILSIGLPGSNLMLSLPLSITSIVKAAAGWYNIDNAGCIAEGVFHAFAFSTTFGTLALLSLDARKKAETGVGMGAGNAYLSIALVWAVSAIGVGFSSIDSPSKESPSGLYCAYELSSIQTYAFLVPVVIVAGACILLVSLQVFFVILPRSENLDGSDVVYQPPLNDSQQNVSVVAAAAAALNAANQVRMRKLEARARLKFLWGLCVLFAAGWLPGIIGFGGVGSTNGSRSNNLDAIGGVILALYSIALPVVQIVLNKNIRAAFFRIVLCKDFFLTLADKPIAIAAPNGAVDVKDIDIELGAQAKSTADPPPSTGGAQSTLQRSVGSDYPSNLTTHLSPLSFPRPISFAAAVPVKHARRVLGVHSNGDTSKLNSSFSQSGNASSFQMPLSPLEPARRLVTGGSSVDVSTLQLSTGGGANDSLLPLPSDPSTPYNASLQKSQPPLLAQIRQANALGAPVTTTISISAHPPFKPSNQTPGTASAGSSAATTTTRTPVATAAANLLAIEAAASAAASVATSVAVATPPFAPFDPKAGSATGPLPKRRIRVHVMNYESELIAALENLDEKAIASAREQRGAKLASHPQRPSSAIDPPASMQSPRNPHGSHSNSPLPPAGTGTPPTKHFAWKMMGSPHSVNRMSPSITPVGGRTPIETPRMSGYSGVQSRNQSLVSSAATSPALRPQQNLQKKRAPMTINQPPSFPVTPRVPKDFEAAS